MECKLWLVCFIVAFQADCIRYKLAAEDANEARDRLEKQMKQLSDEISGLKIKLNSERARHAETAEQSRALTHLAAQLRSKNEKIEKVSEKQQTEIKILRKVFIIFKLCRV